MSDFKKRLEKFKVVPIVSTKFDVKMQLSTIAPRVLSAGGVTLGFVDCVTAVHHLSGFESMRLLYAMFDVITELRTASVAHDAEGVRNALRELLDADGAYGHVNRHIDSTDALRREAEAEFEAAQAAVLGAKTTKGAPN